MAQEMLRNVYGYHHIIPHFDVPKSFVETESALNNTRLLSMSILTKLPIVVQGPFGCGKSCLIKHFASIFGQLKSLVELHINDQTDCKSLLGSYVCSEVPGEFVWRDGILTDAVIRGHWIIIDNVDTVPLEFIASIATLLEHRKLQMPDHTFVIAHDNFRIFGTRSLDSVQYQGSASCVSSMRNFSQFWLFVNISENSVTEMDLIIRTLFPHLLPFIVSKLMTLIAVVNGIGYASKCGLRELLQVCTRLDRYSSTFNTISGVLTDHQKELCVLEIIDVFAISIRDRAKFDAMIKSVLFMWEIVDVDFLKKNILMSIVDDSISIGRISLLRHSSIGTMMTSPQHYLRLMERLAACVSLNESVLLVGETGSGKTTTVQQLAKITGQKLVVLNLSLSTDATDLLGGFQPVSLKKLFLQTYQKFLDLFNLTFEIKVANTEYLQKVNDYYNNQSWRMLLKSFQKAAQAAVGKSSVEKLIQEWNVFSGLVENYAKNLHKLQSGFAFSFVEGLLLNSMRNGYWVLLDEINLASSETLQSISSVLDPLVLTFRDESNGFVDIVRHPKFRVFGAMNPPTDVGKKELSPSIRCKFTEIYTEEVVDSEDLKCLIRPLIATSELDISIVVDIYLECRRMSMSMADGAGLRPHYSLRSLTRTMKTVNALRGINIPLARCFHEAFLLNFQKMLSSSSRLTVSTILSSSGLISSKDIQSRDQLPPCPRNNKGKWVEFRPFWLLGGQNDPVDWAVPQNGTVRFVVTENTPTIRSYIRDIAAGIAADVAPILLQGPTSVGKTTMIEYIAAKAGHTCIRINNHEHTDVQEYIGSFVTTNSGQLEFKDGLLVEAIRKGYWIILDELNLAPTDVLEALNRLLDDNRELLIPETGEIVVPAKGFFLFATQNPPGVYGGRKPLSRAFRNRFLEICVEDLPYSEVKEILSWSCGLSDKVSSMLVQSMKVLHEKRQGSSLFAGKYGAITMRDLIKWGNRKPCNAEEVAEKGYLLLTERLRSADEKRVVELALNSVCKVKLNVESIYFGQDISDLVSAQTLMRSSLLEVAGVKNIAITKSIRRLWVLLSDALTHSEPVLIIGETGCGKTTVCQLMASFKGRTIRILNCHQSTETADIIGGLRPVRGHGLIRNQLLSVVKTLCVDASDLSEVTTKYSDLHNDSINDIHLKRLIDELCASVNLNSEKKKEMMNLWLRYVSIFEWVDGPLVKAMKNGDFFLLDEINLADDAVIERLNSVLESGRSITLTEKGGIVNEKIVAHPDFRFVATMNPGGDYGKRELSPALSSRFTEIWVPPVVESDEILMLINEVLRFSEHSELATDFVAGKLVEFIGFYRYESTAVLGSTFVFSLRDVLSWCRFISTNSSKSKSSIVNAYLHGAHMIFLDGLGMGSTAFKDSIVSLKFRLISFLFAQFSCCEIEADDLGSFFNSSEDVDFTPIVNENTFSVGGFSIPTGPAKKVVNKKFCESSGITTLNLGRIVRALQLSQPILLEGPPGVGKSSLVTNLASLSGHRLVRINLSEHSELSDLLGSDLPSVNSTNETQQFEWRDGVFLKAMKNGDWVLLDELNLAPQTVLEGLNACLDHREEVFIPEVGITVKRSPHFRVFCSQNPMGEGGGRKGLPQSFLNRFSRVYVEAMSRHDLIEIVHSSFSNCSFSLHLDNMVDFVLALQKDISEKGVFGLVGGPWEFNLRDIFRWIDLISLFLDSMISLSSTNSFVQYAISNSAYHLFVCRMRSGDDRTKIGELFSRCLHFDLTVDLLPKIFTGKGFCLIGSAVLNCNVQSYSQPTYFHMTKEQEAITLCVNSNLPVLLVAQNENKFTIIQHLAFLSGNEISYYSASSGTDSGDLLGSFEQSGNGFEWKNGVVVSAILKGHWFIMDNVNLCPSSVLDRLNGLLEPEGMLFLTENGIGEKIVPHPNFRVFFIMDPVSGEISRAMRNRCVEIYLGDFRFNSDLCEQDILSAWCSVATHSKLSSWGSECCRLFSVLFQDNSVSCVPQYMSKNELFRRFCLVAELGLENGYSLKDSVEYALSFVLPGLTFYFDSTIRYSGYLKIDGVMNLEICCWLYILDEQSHQLLSPWFILLLERSSRFSQLSYSLLNQNSNRFMSIETKESNFAAICSLALYNLSLLTCHSIELRTKVLSVLTDYHESHHVALFNLFCSRFSLPESVHDYVLRFVYSPMLDIALPEVLGLDCVEVQRMRQRVMSVPLKFEDFFKPADLSLFKFSEYDDCLEWRIIQICCQLITDLDNLLVENVSLNVFLPSLLRAIVSKRNVLASTLCHFEASNSTMFPMVHLLIAIQWVEKVLTKVGKMSVLCSQLQHICSNAIAAVNVLYSYYGKLCKIEFRYKKIRLWKEGGHAAVPLRSEDWITLTNFRSVWDGKSNCFRLHYEFIKDWLLLYSTFYYYHTSEKDFGDCSKIDLQTALSKLMGNLPKPRPLVFSLPVTEVIVRNHFISVLSDFTGVVSSGWSLSSLEHWLHSLESVIDIAVYHSTISPLFLRELQTIVWRLRKLVIENNESDLSDFSQWCKSFLVSVDRIMFLNSANTTPQSNAAACLATVDLNLVVCDIGLKFSNNLEYAALQNVREAVSQISQLFFLNVVAGSRVTIHSVKTSRWTCLAWQDYRINLLCKYTRDVICSCRDYFRSDIVEVLEELDNSSYSKSNIFEKIRTMIDDCLSSPDLENVLATCLCPLLDILQVPEIYLGFREETSYLVGKAWVLVGLLRCHLLVYSLTIDPAVKPTIKSELLEKSIELVEASFYATKLHNALSCQSPINLNVLDGMEEIISTKNRILNLRLKGIQRPNSCGTFEELVFELRSVLKDYLCIEDYLILLEPVRNDEPRRNTAYHSTLLELCKRLESQYWAYEDITSVVVSTVGNITFGLNILDNLREEKLRLDQFISYPILDDFNFMVDEGADILQSLTLNDYDKKAQIAFMRHKLFRLDHLLSLGAVDFTHAVDEYQKCFDFLTNCYFTDLECRREYESKNSSSFSSFLESDSNMAVDSFEHQDSSGMDEHINDVNLVENSSVSVMVVKSHFGLEFIHLKTHYQRLGHLWSDSSDSSPDYHEDIDQKLMKASSVFESGLVAAKSLHDFVVDPILDTISRGSCLKMLITMYCNLNESGEVSSTKSSYSTFDRDAAYLLCGDGTRNFRTDSFPAQTKKSIAIIERLVDKSNQFLDLFPENELLIQVKRSISQISVCHITCPPNRLMYLFQSLLRHIHEWESVAAKSVSFNTEVEDLIMLLVDWKQLEIKGWEHLLRAKEIDFVKKSCFLWYEFSRMFACEFSTVNSDLHCFSWKSLNHYAPGWLHCVNVGCSFHIAQSVQSLFDSLDTIIRQSVIGDFPAKLHILRLFAVHLQNRVSGAEVGDHCELVQVANIVSNIWQYYEYFLGYVRKFQEKLKAPLQTKVQDEITMERWDTKNSQAFMDQSERVNRKLNKIILDYDESVLRLPFATVLHEVIMGGIVTSSGDVESANTIPALNALFPVINDEEVSNPQEIVCSTNGRVACEIADSCVANIFDRLEHLRSQNTTKNMKLRAVADLRNALRDLGFSSLSATVPEQCKSNVSIFALNSPLSLEFLTDLTFCKVPRDILEKSEMYFFRNVVEINQLRVQSVSSVSEDVAAFSKEFVGFAENMFCSVLRLRCGVAAALSDLKRLMIQFGTMSAHSFKTPERAANVMFDNLIQFSALVKSAIAMSSDIRIAGHPVKYDEFSCSKVCSALDESCKLLYSLTVEAKCAQSVSNRHFSTLHIRTSSISSDFLRTARNSQSILNSVVDTLELLVSGDVVARIVSQFESFIVYSESELKFYASERSVGGFTDFPDCSTFKFNGGGSFSGSYGEISSERMDCLLSSMVKSLNSVESYDFDGLMRFLASASNSEFFVSVKKRFVFEYSSLVDDVIATYGSVNKLLYIVLRILRTLFAKGVCASAVQENESTEDDTMLHDGTGMGEGSGGKDVSDQIEYEEQLLGMKDSDDQVDKSTKAENGENDDNGVEMEQEFGGDYVDAAEDVQSNSENESTGSSDELDRELGEANVNEAVDERSWNNDDSMNEEFQDNLDIDGENFEVDAEKEIVTNERESLDGGSVDKEKESSSDMDIGDEEVVSESSSIFDTDPTNADDNDGQDSDAHDSDAHDSDADLDEDLQANDAECNSEDDLSAVELKKDSEKPGESKGRETFGVNRATDNAETILNDLSSDEKLQCEVNTSTSTNHGDSGQGNMGNAHDEVGLSTSKRTIGSSHSRNDEANPFRFAGTVEDFWHNKLDLLGSEDQGLDGKDENKNEESGGQFEHAISGNQQVLDVSEEISAVPIDRTNEIEGEIGHEGPQRKRDNDYSEEFDGSRPKKSRVDDVGFRDSEMTENEESQVPEANLLADSLTFQDMDKRSMWNTNRNWIFGSKHLETVDGAAVETVKTINESIESTMHISTDIHAIRLCEQLRLILEPTLKTRLQGDYRSGKRLNMRKIIPYLASGYRKDKIWLRRTKPAKRNYQVMIMTDNSKSMGIAGSTAISTMVSLASALSRLEIGEICVVKFDDKAHILHEFGRTFGENSASNIRQQFNFQSDHTRLASCLQSIIPEFERGQSRLSVDDSIVLQICFIISDARIDSDNRQKLDEVIRTMSSMNILVVLVIIDKNLDPKDSIFNTKSVTFDGNKVVTTSYFDDFPFPYYIAVENVSLLPELLSSALKQWFELISLQLRE